jgi:dTMP kinase
MLIVFEGIDGSGKTTQAKLLSRKLESQGVDVVYSKEPTEGIIGKLIRTEILNKRNITNVLTVVLLYAADRAQHVSEVNLGHNSVNIFDRYYFSSMAYQSCAGASLKFIQQVNSFAPAPDLAFLLDIDPKVSLKRLSVHDEFERIEYLKDVRRMYLRLANKYNMIVLDAESNMSTLAEKIFKVVGERLLGFSK